MGMITSRIHRAAGRFNAESRAERVLSKAKPEPAPRHPSTGKYLQDAINDEEVKRSLSMKDPKLDDFLKNVYVSSYDPPQLKNPKLGKPSERDRLPQYRGTVKESELGFMEIEEAPEGKISLHQVMKLLVNAQADPKLNDANTVSAMYKLQPRSAENILKYFGNLQVIINPTEDPKVDIKKLIELTIIGKRELVKK